VRRGARPSRRRPTTHTLMTPSAPFGAPVEFTSRSACSCVCSSSRSAWAASAAVPQQPPRAVTPSARLRARAVWGGNIYSHYWSKTVNIRNIRIRPKFSIHVLSEFGVLLSSRSRPAFPELLYLRRILLE
jgi:hypothetical protein